MKQILSLLMAFIFLQVQTWALSGGPVYPGSGTSNQAGVYSGVLVQTSNRLGAAAVVRADNLDNAGNIGVFGVTVPITGAATGTAVFFIGGIIFTGTMSGVANPDQGTFDATIQATATFDVIVQPEIRNAAGVIIQPEVTVTPLAQGMINARIIESLGTPLAGRQDISAGNAARMTGRATVDAFVSVDSDFSPITLVQSRYSVSGFRQSTTPLP